MIHETTDPAGASELLASDPSAVYIDVRTVEEFEQGHPPGAYNIPILFRGSLGMQPNPDFAAVVKRCFAPTTRIVFGCKSGGRSARACELLASQGYGRLVNMAGGFHGAFDDLGRPTVQGWAARGLPQEREAPAERTWKGLSSGAEKPEG